MQNTLKLNSKECIEHLKKDYGSYYSISKALDEYGLTVQPIQLSNYHKGKRVMSHSTAKYFFVVFGIEITDSFKGKGRTAQWS